ncbi:MAG TPA: hypothetical protein PKI14_13325 [Fervidobacterium sp.]|nr:hypothetical protein [Fervidobacterium sp.]HPZ18270.1 hypothetical protein [Fervidobacterium sp.]HQE49535.1 hypothetical protein [Fervidobacterium sp.]HUM43920.1 hypothetical protein [Fervidobacterium sp.]
MSATNVLGFGMITENLMIDQKEYSIIDLTKYSEKSPPSYCGDELLKVYLTIGQFTG